MPRKTFERRSVLGGIGAGVLGFGNSLSDRKRTVVTARNANGPVEVEKVSKRWLKHRDEAHRVKSRLSANHDEIVGAALTQSDTVVGQRRGFDIRITVSDSSTSHSIPTSVEGIDVVTQPEREGKRLGCFNDGPYTELKGGVYCSQDTSTDNYATTTAMVEDSGDYLLLVPAHMFDTDDGDGSCEDPSDESLYHQGTYFGSEVAHGIDNDWALVDVPQSEMTSGILTSDDGKIHSISSWFTKSGIDIACSDNRTMLRQGVTSGFDSGECTATGGDGTGPEGCIDPDYKLDFNIDSAQGDSGGPIWAWGKNNPDNAVLAGWVSWGTFRIETISACNGRSAAVMANLHSPLFETLYDQRGIAPV